MKKLWITTAVLVSLAAGAYFYLRVRKSKDFEPLIKKKLVKLVQDGSNGLYILEMDKIEVDVIESTIIAINVRLKPDSARLQELDKLKQLPNDIYKVQLKTLAIKGLSPGDLLDKKNIDLDALLIEEPSIEIFHKKRSYNFKDSATLYSRIAGKGGSYALKKLDIENVDLTYRNLENNNKPSTFKKVSINLSDIRIDSLTQYDTTRFLFAKQANISLKGYKANTPDNLYNFLVDSLSINANAGSLEAYKIALQPIGNKQEFSKKLTYMVDRIDMKIKSMSVVHVKWWQLMTQEGFFGDTIQLNNGTIEVYNDKGLPLTTASKVGEYPSQLVMKMKLPMYVPVMLVKDFNIKYVQFNPKSGETGTIEFANVQAVFSNITNIAENINKSPILDIETSSEFMGAGKLKARFRFDMAKVSKGNFIVDANLGKMDGKLMNRASIGMGLVKIESLQIDGLTTHIEGDDYNAAGKLGFAYHDIKVEVLKKDENEDGEKKKKGLATFIVNNFIIKKNNPKEGKPLEEVTCTSTRDIHKSFFNIVWKALGDGMVKSATGKK